MKREMKGKEVITININASLEKFLKLSSNVVKINHVTADVVVGNIQ